MSHQTILEIELSQKEILNANSIPSHFIVKGNMVSHLREMAGDLFILLHPEEWQETATRMVMELRAANEVALKKKRLRKRLQDSKKSLTPEEIEEEIADKFPEVEKTNYEIPPLHTHFTVQVVVYPPTRRRLDPPNLYPTVKPILDGGTDAGSWGDDDFSHLLEMSFRYGGLSGLKSRWRLKLIFTEVDDLSEFQMETEHVLGD